jgi:hypothetical protein
MRALHEDRQPSSGAQMHAEVARRRALVRALVLLIAEHADRQVHLLRVAALRRRDRIPSWLHASERRDEIADAGSRRRKFDQHVEHIVHAERIGLRVVVREPVEPRAIDIVFRLVGKQPVERFAWLPQLAFARKRFARGHDVAIAQRCRFGAPRLQDRKQQLDLVRVVAARRPAHRRARNASPNRRDRSRHDAFPFRHERRRAACSRRSALTPVPRGRSRVPPSVAVLS